MIEKNKINWMILLAFLCFAFVLPACIVNKTSSESAQEANQPVVVITQFITQVVATPTITPIPEPTEPPPPTVIPTLTGGWDPFKVDIYYPIPGCVASRLHTGDVAFVATGAGQKGIHYSKDIGYAPTFRLLEAGELVDIYRGPWCVEGNIIWRVAAADGVVGFVSEGNGETYWLLPMPPGTKQVLSKEKLREAIQKLQ